MQKGRRVRFQMFSERDPRRSGQSSEYPPQEACSFYAVCVFFVSLSVFTKFPTEKDFLKKVYRRKPRKEASIWASATEEEVSMPEVGCSSRRKVSNTKCAGKFYRKKGQQSPAGPCCVESFPEALFCFCSLENSVLFLFEATVDLMLSVV